MLEIYFDGVLLDPNNYMELTQKWVMFDKEFKLGMTPSREFNLTIPKSVFNPNTQEVKIKYMNEDYAYLVIDKYSYDESVVPKVKITLVDKMVKANFNYDASPICPTTIKGILLDICSKMGVELGNTSFDNEDEAVNFWDSTVMAREYISYISEMAGGFARIENDGKLWIRKFSNQNVKPITSDLCEQIIIGQKHKVERVVFDNGVLKFETSQDTSLETLYLNPSNVYINTKEQFDLIVANILNFEYYNIDTGNTYILPNTLCGDVLSLTYKNINYYTIQNTPDLKYMGAWQGKYQLNLESQQQAETQVRGVGTQVKAIKIKQDRDENILSIAVQDIQTQQNVTNPQLEDKITANTTLINQTANDIRLEVSASNGVLQGNIDNVASDLAEADGRLTGAIANNTTLINQISTAIISTIRSTGGSNLLRNSVGYSGTDFWQKTGTVTTNQDDNMSLSGSEFILTGDSTLSQAYNTQLGVTYSVSCKIKHRAVGTANQIKIEIIGQGGTSKTILDTTETFSEWHDVSIDEPYIATITNPSIKITCSGDDILEITDLIISFGENNVWSGYIDEVYGKEHKLDRNGLRLSNLAGNTASKTTSNSIQMLIGEMVVAELSKQVVKSDTAVITNSFTLGNLQTVVLDNDNIIEYI